MSLINQMLKDLDARRVDGGGSPFGEQVRAVPPRKRVHPAWWLVLVLALVLVGIVGWIVLRPAPADPHAAYAHLPLRLALELGSIDAPASASPGADKQTAETVPAMKPQPSPVESAPAMAVEAPLPIVANPVAEMQVPPPVSAPLVQAAVLEPLPADEPDTAPAADVEPAAPIVKQMREATPQQRAENAYRAAVGALRQGRKAEAREGFEQALGLDSEHAGARQTLIALLLESGESNEALRLAREGLELDARQVGWAMIVARLQVEKGELNSALETLERTRTHAADHIEFIAFHAALLQRAARHAEAAEQYVRALRRAPGNGLWWMGLGISLQAGQRNDEAREAFQRAQDSDALTPELAAFVAQRLAELR